MSKFLRKTKIKFGELAVQSRLVTQEKLDQALATQEETGPWRCLGDILMEMGVCTREDINHLIDIQNQLRTSGLDVQAIMKESGTEETYYRPVMELSAGILGKNGGR